MRETDLNEDVRVFCGDRRLFWQRFEDKLQSGIPDGYMGANWLHQGRGVWFENKITATRGARPEYRRGQLPWALEAARRGERCVTLVATPEPEGVWFRLLDTASVALAVVSDQPWPEPLYAGLDLTIAVGIALATDVPPERGYRTPHTPSPMRELAEHTDAEARRRAGGGPTVSIRHDGRAAWSDGSEITLSDMTAP